MTYQIIDAQSFLSGDVHAKLEAAKEAAIYDPSYLREVEALSGAIPDCVPIGLVDIRIGATWIPTSYYEEFCWEVFEEKIQFFYSPLAGTWETQLKTSGESQANKQHGFCWQTCDSQGYTITEWYTAVAKKPEDGLFTMALLFKAPSISVKASKDAPTKKDQAETAKAVAKQEELQMLFANWCKEGDKGEQLEKIYNTKINRTVLPNWDGKGEHLQEHSVASGMSKEWAAKLRPYQWDAIWRMCVGGNTLLGLEVGLGKAQSLDAKILTPTGWKRMGDINAGDEVIAVDGKPTQVIGVYPQGLKDIYRVTMSDGTSTECCDEHLWQTLTYQERNNIARANCEGRDLSHRCAYQPKIRTLNEIRQSLVARSKIKNHSIPMVHPVEFEAVSVIIPGYTLGVILGDGSISGSSIVIHSPDKDIIELIEGELSDTLEIYQHNQKNEGCCLAYSIRRKNKQTRSGSSYTTNLYLQELNTLGLQGHTAHEKFVPDLYKFNSIDVRLAVLQGLIDTDGYIMKDGSHTSFTTTSRQLADDVVFLVQSLGGVADIRTKIPSYTYKGEKHQGRKAYTVRVNLPPEIIPVRSKRRLERFVPKSKYRPVRYIVGAELVGKKEAQCIAIAHPSHLYVTDDFIVTHNTGCLISAAMLRRFYKTSKKALFVVQRSTLKQFEASFREMYPDAKVLCATPEDCSASNRQRLLAKAALWDWDAIILTHESFNKIPVKAQTERVYIAKQLEIVEMELDRLYEMGESAKAKGKKRGNRIVKKLEETRNKIRSRIDLLAKSRDSGIYFEDIDPDILIIDEAQKYKNAFVATKLQVTGINISESGRAQDFDLKLAYLREQHKQGFLWLSTGTPEPTNSMVGVYVYQRYLHPEELEKRGLAHFDAWAMNFGRVVSEAEFKADGGLRITDRFCEFVNLPELLQMWLSSCHIKRFDDVAGQAGFTRPMPKHKKVSCHLSDWQLNYMDYIQRRYELIAKRNPLKWWARDKDECLLDEDGKRLYHPLSGDPVTDIEVAIAHGLEVGTITDCFFKICSESRNLMIAPQLLDPDLPIETGDKLSQAVRRIHRWWGLTAKDKSTQLVFLDVGTPGGSAKFCIYDWLRQQLRDKGIPDDEMAFIHDYKDDEKKAELFDKVNAGEIRVLFGSTEPMGIGVNVQKKVKVVHLIDIPRRPDQYEQRLGRAIRFGNENPTVLVYQYLTRGKNGNFGANAFELQLLEKKVKVREDILRGDPTVRRVVEDNNQIEMYMKLKAHSSGDERILRYVDCAAQLDKAKAKSALCITDLNRLHGAIKDADRRILSLELELANIVPDIETARSHIDCVDGDLFVCQVDDAFHVGMGFVERGKGKFKKPQFKMALCQSSAIAFISILSYPTVKQAKHAADKHIQHKIDSLALELRFTANNGKQWHIGYFGGFELWCMLHSFKDKTNVTMWLKGQTARSPVEYRTSQLRLIRNLINAHADVLDRDVHAQSALVKQRETLSKWQADLVSKRAEKERLVAAVASLELEKQQLAAALNLNEN